jgi:hypothetical protein
MTRLLLFTVLLLSSTALADGGQRGHGRGRWGRPPQPAFDMELLRALTSTCNDAMEGPDNERQCLDIVSRSRRTDVAELVRACEDAMEGDPNELSCISTMTRSWLALGAVRACEDAMEGDANELRCMAAVVGSRYEPAQLVTYCEENETGDEAELACIARWR